jgi:MFS family permease
VLEIFFLQDRLGLPGFYFGPMVAAEAGGLALGALFADTIARRGYGRPALIAGVVGTGFALATMTLVSMLLAVLACALLLGLFNALAVTGARVGLFAGFTGFERRAIASAEAWLVALAGVVGAGLFTVFYAGVAGIPGLPSALARLPFPGWPVGIVMLGTGIVLVVSAIIFVVLLARKQRAAKASSRSAADGDFDGWGDEGYEGESAYLPAADGWDGESAYMPAADGWDDGYEDDAPSEYGPAQRGRPGGGAPGRSSSRAPNRGGGLLSRQFGGDDDDGSPGRGGSSGGRRNRW